VSYVVEDLPTLLGESGRKETKRGRKQTKQRVRQVSCIGKRGSEGSERVGEASYGPRSEPIPNKGRWLQKKHGLKEKRKKAFTRGERLWPRKKKKKRTSKQIHSANIHPDAELRFLWGFGVGLKGARPRRHTEVMEKMGSNIFRQLGGLETHPEGKEGG